MTGGVAKGMDVHRRLGEAGQPTQHGRGWLNALLPMMPMCASLQGAAVTVRRVLGYGHLRRWIASLNSCAMPGACWRMSRRLMLIVAVGLSGLVWCTYHRY
jgi:hypothetical protein